MTFFWLNFQCSSLVSTPYSGLNLKFKSGLSRESTSEFQVRHQPFSIINSVTLLHIRSFVSRLWFPFKYSSFHSSICITEFMSSVASFQNVTFKVNYMKTPAVMISATHNSSSGLLPDFSSITAWIEV